MGIDYSAELWYGAAVDHITDEQIEIIEKHDRLEWIYSDGYNTDSDVLVGISLRSAEAGAIHLIDHQTFSSDIVKFNRHREFLNDLFEQDLEFGYQLAQVIR